jgi:hypothetical protein
MERGDTVIARQYKMTTEVPDGILTPDRVESRIGTLRFIAGGDPRPAVENTRQHFRVYPLDRAVDPPAMTFVNFSGEAFSTIPATDASFFEHVATVVQEEPLDTIDLETRGLLAAIGIRKDQPFAPDQRMQRILADAAAVINATGRTPLYSTCDRGAYYYPNSDWKMSWTALWTSISDRCLPWAKRATGSRPSPAKGGGPTCGFTDPSKRGSTRPGDPERLSGSIEKMTGLC